MLPWPLNIDGNALCPCESGRMARECCGVGGKVAPRQHLPPHRASRTRYAHPRCYARCLNDCSTRISREHAISASLLERLERTGGVYVQGFPWQTQERQKLSVAALASNILCQQHNSDLSGLDAVGLRLVDHLERALVGFEERALVEPGARASGQDWVWLMNGHDLERWLLKTYCGLSVTLARSRDLPAVVDDRLVKILFAHFVMPRTGGLFVSGRVGERWTAARNTLTFATLLRLEREAGLTATVGGFTFALAFNDVPPLEQLPEDSPINPKSIRRPTMLCMTYDDVENVVCLHWDESLPNMKLTVKWSPPTLPNHDERSA